MRNNSRMPAFQRDPLSVRFDPQARFVIGRAIDQFQARKTNTRLVPWVRVTVPNLPGTMVRDQGGLSAAERAFQRSCYHDERIHKPRKNTGGPWSLKLEWETVPAAPGGARRVKVQVFGSTSGKRHSDRNPGQSWVENPELRSGGIGSGLERFG